MSIVDTLNNIKSIINVVCKVVDIADKVISYLLANVKGV